MDPMKTTLLSLSLLALLGACSKWQSNQKQITNISTDGTWISSSYIDDGDDETADFATFRLNFLESGVLNATDLLSSNSNPYVGSWSITDSNSNDDDNLDDLDFNINFIKVSCLSDTEGHQISCKTCISSAITKFVVLSILCYI